MRITNRGDGPLEPGGIPLRDGRRPLIDGPSFDQTMSAAHEGMSREQIAQIAAKLDQLSEQLAAHPNWPTLRGYKELVREFITEVLARIYRVRNRSGRDRQGRQKVYVLVQRVDEELEELTELIRQGQVRGFDVLEKLNEIRGLLMDLRSW